jgi:hypothetical protein
LYQLANGEYIQRRLIVFAEIVLRFTVAWLVLFAFGAMLGELFKHATGSFTTGVFTDALYGWGALVGALIYTGMWWWEERKDSQENVNESERKGLTPAEKNDNVSVSKVQSARRQPFTQRTKTMTRSLSIPRRDTAATPTSTNRGTSRPRTTKVYNVEFIHPAGKYRRLDIATFLKETLLPATNGTLVKEPKTRTNGDQVPVNIMPLRGRRNPTPNFVYHLTFKSAQSVEKFAALVAENLPACRIREGEIEDALSDAA